MIALNGDHRIINADSYEEHKPVDNHMLWPGAGAETPMPVRRETIVLMQRPEQRHALFGPCFCRYVNDTPENHRDQEHMRAIDDSDRHGISAASQQVLDQSLQAKAHCRADADA